MATVGKIGFCEQIFSEGKCRRSLVRTGLSVQELAPKSEVRASEAHLAGCTNYPQVMHTIKCL